MPYKKKRRVFARRCVLDFSSRLCLLVPSTSVLLIKTYETRTVQVVCTLSLIVRYHTVDLKQARRLFIWKYSYNMFCCGFVQDCKCFTVHTTTGTNVISYSR